MKPFDHDPNLRWLFCLTHPDDDIAICAWIQRLTQAGNEVYMSWTHSNPVREAEARIVAKTLGVPETNLTFFEAIDGGICNQLEGLLPQFQALMERVKPDRVACGAFEQGHLDHDATNWLVNNSFEGPVFEIPFYHSYAIRLQTMNAFADPTGQDTIHLTKAEQKLKLQIAKSYRSQNIWSVLWWHEVYQMTRFKPAKLRKRELMRLQTHRDFLTPNLPEPHFSRVKACPSWKRWVSAVERLNMPP